MRSTQLPFAERDGLQLDLPHWRCRFKGAPEDLGITFFAIFTQGRHPKNGSRFTWSITTTSTPRGLWGFSRPTSPPAVLHLMFLARLGARHLLLVAHRRGRQRPFDALEPTIRLMIGDGVSTSKSETHWRVAAGWRPSQGKASEYSVRTLSSAAEAS